MRVSYEWTRELVDIEATPEEVSEKLTAIGLEVEGTESIEGDTVFEVNVTPNRPDCLSMIGIARELAAAFQVPLKIPPHELPVGLPVSEFSIEIVHPQLCNRYTGRFIKDAKIGGSPEWMKKRLEKCGIRSINNVVDITNYVLLEFGHPLHAFDADKIEGKKIKVSTAGRDNKFETLDGTERALPEDTLLICDSTRPIAVAGVMGGLNTEVSERTKNIFLESAYFEPFSIRRTSKRLGLTSESSYRFERGTDIEFLEKALNRAALMIRDIAGGTIFEIIDAYPVKYRPEPFEVKYEKINKLLGTLLSKGEMLDILQRLDIPAEDKEQFFVVSPPAYRRDLRRASDVAEEIARIYGFNSIQTTLPRSPLSSGSLNKKKTDTGGIREAVRKAGFTEVINLSFMRISDLDVLAIDDTDRRRKIMAISNPLVQEEGFLRTTLAPALLGNLKYNLDRGMKEIRFFEISRVFEDMGESLPLEELRLGAIYYRETVPSLWKEEAQGFYIVKGALESLFNELKINNYSFTSSSEPFLHRGQSADILIANSSVGYLGVMSPEAAEKLDLKKQKPEIVLFELNLDVLLSLIPDSLQYTAIPKYPPIERDIAIIVDQTIPSSHIREMIQTFPSELIEDVSVFDSYKGGNIPSGKKSLAFSIVYRSMERTLREEEVESLHSSIVTQIIEKTAGELRK
jgi:phenylalanyl-tRNA synthetase beta chain